MNHCNEYEENIRHNYENEKKFVLWIKKNKKIIIVTGISTIALTGLIIGIKNRNNLMKIRAYLDECVNNVPKGTSVELPAEQNIKILPDVPEFSRNYTRPNNPVDVTEHIRNLPGNRHHSEKKAAEALQKNIILEPNQTFVSRHTKYAV